MVLQICLIVRAFGDKLCVYNNCQKEIKSFVRYCNSQAELIKLNVLQI